MVKKLWQGTDQNYVKNMPKYAMAPGAEANGTHYYQLEIQSKFAQSVILQFWRVYSESPNPKGPFGVSE